MEERGTGAPEADEMEAGEKDEHEEAGDERKAPGGLTCTHAALGSARFSMRSSGPRSVPSEQLLDLFAQFSSWNQRDYVHRHGDAIAQNEVVG